MKPEYVVLLDNNENEIGTAEKLSTHHANTPLHKAFSCYVFNDEGQLLVTRRADSKKVWPGVWTNSVCGHPGPGESNEAAITRRLQYELGMTADKVACIVTRYHYKTPPYKGIIEHESCPIYTAHATSQPQPNPDEVGDYKWMNWDDYVAELTADPADVYSWWSKDQLQHIRAAIEELLSSQS